MGETPMPRKKYASSGVLLPLDRRGFAMLDEDRLVTLRDRHSSPESKRAAGDFQPRRSLAALVLRAIDQADDLLHDLGVVPFGDDLRRGELFFHVQIDYRIEKLIRRQRILVRLVGPQLGAGDLLDAARGDDLFAEVAVDPARKLPDRRFGNIGDDS